MTQADFNDLDMLGRKIQAYTRELANCRALIDGRVTLAKGLRSKYPNMKIDAIRSTLWKQEQEQIKKAQEAFDMMRVFAVSCGWSIEYKDVEKELTGLRRADYVTFQAIYL